MKFSFDHFLIKMTSRSFWGVIAAFVGSTLALYNFKDSEIVQITALIGQVGSIVVYLLTNTNTITETTIEKTVQEVETTDGK